MPDEKLARAIRTKIRRSILQNLCEVEKMSVTDISEKSGISEPTASKNLQFLYDLGFLDYESDKKFKIYFIKIPELKDFFRIYNEIADKL